MICLLLRNLSISKYVGQFVCLFVTLLLVSRFVCLYVCLLARSRPQF